MAKKRYSPEQIITMLREAEFLLNLGLNSSDDKDIAVQFLEKYSANNLNIVDASSEAKKVEETDHVWF